MRTPKWNEEWKCECGQLWRGWCWPTRFQMFGFSDRCPRCFAIVGIDGPPNQVRYEIVRYIRVTRPDWAKRPFRWYDPQTWCAPSKLVREVRYD